jgi:hypothetical protein
LPSNSATLGRYKITLNIAAHIKLGAQSTSVNEELHSFLNFMKPKKTSKLTLEILEIMVQISCFMYIKSKFTFTSQTNYICSKQYENQSEYYCDAIKRSFEEKSLFEFPIVTLIASLEHKTYSELQNLGFSTK